MALKKQNAEKKANPEPVKEEVVEAKPVPVPVVVVAPPVALPKVPVKQTSAFEDIYSNEQLP
jgi:hypothetical protein